MDAYFVRSRKIRQRRIHKLIKNRVFTHLAKGRMKRARNYVLRGKPAVRMQSEPDDGRTLAFKEQAQISAQRYGFPERRGRVLGRRDTAFPARSRAPPRTGKSALRPDAANTAFPPSFSRRPAYRRQAVIICTTSENPAARIRDAARRVSWAEWPRPLIRALRRPYSGRRALWL